MCCLAEEDSGAVLPELEVPLVGGALPHGMGFSLRHGPHVEEQVAECDSAVGETVLSAGVRTEGVHPLLLFFELLPRRTVVAGRALRWRRLLVRIFSVAAEVVGVTFAVASTASHLEHGILAKVGGGIKPTLGSLDAESSPR